MLDRGVVDGLHNLLGAHYPALLLMTLILGYNDPKRNPIPNGCSLSPRFLWQNFRVPIYQGALWQHSAILSAARRPVRDLSCDLATAVKLLTALSRISKVSFQSHFFAANSAVLLGLSLVILVYS